MSTSSSNPPPPNLAAGPAPGPGSDADEAAHQSPLLTFTLGLEDRTGLDPLVDTIDEAIGPVLGRPDLKALLGGRWTGHALHPLLTDLPIGFWTSATVLDLIGGRRAATATQRLVGLGVLSAVPTAVTGWSDWLSLDRPLRRVGVVHAASNAAAVGLYAFSWMARRKGHRGRGVMLGLLGGAVVSGAGYLGGHLTVGRGAGVQASHEALHATRPA